MKLSELIKELSTKLRCYGDFEVLIEPERKSIQAIKIQKLENLESGEHKDFIILS